MTTLPLNRPTVSNFFQYLTYFQYGLDVFTSDLLHSQTKSFPCEKGSLMAPLLQGLLEVTPSQKWRQLHDSRIFFLALLTWFFPACLTEKRRNVGSGLLWKDRDCCVIKYCSLNITSGSMLSCNYLPSSTVESSWVTLTARRSILSWREFALM